VALVLGILSVLRWIEDRMRKESFAQVMLGISQGAPLSKSEIDTCMMACGLRIVEASYGFERSRAAREYEFIVAGYDPDNLRMLAEQLASRPDVMSFHISLSRD
jgi:hypothetical protein